MAEKLSSSLLDIQKRIKNLREMCITDSTASSEVLADALVVLSAAEKHIMESDECYHTFIAHSSDGIWRLESEQPMPLSMTEDDQIEFILENAYFAECNDACARMYGLTDAEELIGKRMIDILPRSDQRNIEVIRAFIRSGYRLVDNEACKIDKDGNSLCIISSVTGIVENNYLMRVWGVQRDITERKRAEEALRMSEERFRVLNDNLSSGVALIDESGMFVLYNPAFLRMFGLSNDPSSLEYINGQNWDVWQMFDENGLLFDVHDHPIRKAALTGKSVRNKLVCVRLPAGGDLVWILVSAEPILKPDGKIDSLICTYHDITELKRAEKALRQSEEKSRLLIKYAPSMIYELDFNGHKFKSVNDEMCKTLGYTREELLAMDPFDLLQGESKTVFKDRTRRMLVGEPIKDFVEYIVKTKDGRELYGALRVTSIFRDGKPEGALVVAHDVTERKQMEMRLAREVLERTEELSKAKQELETANEELRLDLVKHEKLEARLLEAKEAAEAAAQAKSDFLANMSHEIRTPMNAVIGMTSLLIEDETLTAEQKDFIETIRMSGDALMVIINDILDFSKMQEDKVVLEVQPFDLRSCIEESLDLVAARANEKGLNLAYLLPETVPRMIFGDPNRLRQILVNLLGNAVKFTEKGEVKLSVSSQKLDGNYDIHFAVQDTGIGLTADQMDHLFQPFSQVDASITRKYGGTGLGLAISKKLIELMNGNAWVESKPGKGSTFHFIIKVEVPSIGEEEPLAGVQPGLIGKHVLIVDDNKTNRHILGAYAYSWGMVPIVASCSNDVLDWMRRGDFFDIAILNMNMKDIDGLTLARKIREYEKSLPLVMLASVGENLGSDLFEDYLTKPIKPSQLLNIFIKIISQKPLNPSSTTRKVTEKTEINPMRILLAEDNVSSQKATLQMLKRLGYRADVVANGIEALQALERQSYDLVLMDVRMPEMDGMEAIRIIRERWLDNGPKVIAVTAFALQGDRERCLAAGMNDYISKPVKIIELKEVLSKYQQLQNNSW
jgi:PAS domain S-box-containing protein